MRALDMKAFGRHWLALALAVLLTSPLLIAAVGLTPALDFTGGTEILLRLDRPRPVEEVRRLAGDAAVTRVGAGDSTYAVRTGPLPGRADAEARRLAGALGAEVLGATAVGPVVGEGCRRDTVLALAASALGLLAYMSARFELRSGLAALLALVHDALAVLAVLAVARVEIDVAVVAALLTALGYSLNDSIVILDRVREDRDRARDPAGAVTRALQHCLWRTAITGVTVLFTLAAIGLVGPRALAGFALAMTAGVVSGTLSTVTVVCPLVARRVTP